MTEHGPCPLTQTWDAAIAVRDAVYWALGFKVFIIPVLLLPDTQPDPLIEEWAGHWEPGPDPYLDWKRRSGLHPHLEDLPRPPDQEDIASEARRVPRKLKISYQETIS